MNVVGARPNFMKVAPIQRAMGQYPQLEPVLVHTGQHYDEKMSKIFFDDLELPQPEVYLGVGSGSHAKQTAAIMVAFEDILLQYQPDAVLVVGDVNSTVACALTATKLHVPVIHVEAGLRSGDRRMPEEINRIVTDALSDILFVTEQSGLDHLKQEGIAAEKVHFVGNVMIDSLRFYQEKARQSSILTDLGLSPWEYALVTLHRPSNVDDKAALQTILSAFSELDPQLPVIFPVHPRTRQRLIDFGFQNQIESLTNFRLLPPLGYLDFLNAMQHAMVVITDSGGIQEETTALSIPCLTLRENTERPVTITLGTNQLIPLETGAIVAAVQEILAGNTKTGQIPPLWDGHTAERIVKIINHVYHA